MHLPRCRIEDHNQVRDRTSAQNLTLYREINAKVLRDPKGFIRPKHKIAAFYPAFRGQIADTILAKPMRKP
jgi:hypothetical protein